MREGLIDVIINRLPGLKFCILSFALYYCSSRTFSGFMTGRLDGMWFVFWRSVWISLFLFLFHFLLFFINIFYFLLLIFRTGMESIFSAALLYGTGI